jgi:actin, other eukaryote
MDYDVVPICLMNNSFHITAGFTGDCAPRSIFPSSLFFFFNQKAVRGTIKTGMTFYGSKEYYIGDEAASKNQILDLTYPVEKGIIQNFASMEEVWHHTFYTELRVSPDEHPVIMSEEPANTRNNRFKTTQIMFETFSIPGFFLAQTSLLSLYASGRTTGAVLNMGHTKNDVCAIINGNLLPKAEISYLAGRELTEHLLQLFLDKGTDLGNQAYTRLELVQDIKEKMCYVKNSGDSHFRDYKLPDGTIIKDLDRNSIPELLFDKYQTGEEMSIQELVSKCIHSKDKDLKDELYSNIVLTGGGSMFEGIAERLEFELNRFHSKKIKVIAPPERKYSHWIGASILTSLSTFDQVWIEKDQYEEYGPDIINYFCFDNVGVNHQIRKSNQLSEKIKKMKNELKFTNIHFLFE